MTQKDLADCCNVTQSHISNVLNGRASARKLKPVIYSVLDQWEAQRKTRRKKHIP
nr:MAG TPA: helix-turn-helix domain protein [Caudoviricetes sp.]DAW54072.1 MAG TPA: helix-turn-helix domain protein [Caudoviricetes sp.]